MKGSCSRVALCSFSMIVCVAALWPAVSQAGRLAADEFLPPLAAGRGWQLAWADEFDGKTIDASKWEVLGDWKRRDGYWVRDDSYLDGEGHLIVRELQPNTVIFNGPDIRWVGNEGGYARQSEWSVMNRNRKPFDFINPTQKDLGSLEALGEGDYLVWYPAETDVSIRPGWFYHAREDDKVKSVRQLLDIYFRSVGYNSVLLLNLPPDRRGLIHENDVQRLREFRKALDAIFAENLAAGAKATASNVKGGNPAFAAGKITDGDPQTFWTTDDWTTAAEIEFDLGKPRTFNVAEMAEHIRTGQRISEFALDAWDGGNWKEFARGTTVGYKRLLRFADVTASKVRLRILDSRVSPTLSGFGLYRAPATDEIVSASAPSGR